MPRTSQCCNKHRESRRGTQYKQRRRRRRPGLAAFQAKPSWRSAVAAQLPVSVPKPGHFSQQQNYVRRRRRRSPAPARRISLRQKARQRWPIRILLQLQASRAATRSVAQRQALQARSRPQQWVFAKLIACKPGGQRSRSLDTLKAVRPCALPPQTARACVS